MTVPRALRTGLLRKSRALLASRHWKARLVFWVGALAIGAVSAAFAKLADLSQRVFTAIWDHPGMHWLPLILTPLAFIFCAWAADRFFPGSQGSGIPQAIAIRHLRDDKDRAGYLTLWTVTGKIFLTLIAFMFGASIGREGPTVQLGAAIMLASGRFGGMAKARGLILAGSAAGIAAAFNAPLAGVVFAIEEMSRSYHARTNWLVLSTVIISGISSLVIVGSYTYFGETDVVAKFPGEWPLVVVCGIVGGAIGGIFSRAVLELTRIIRRWRRGAPRRRLLIAAGTAGLVIAVVGIAYGGSTYGTGYQAARHAIEGGTLPVTYFLAKFVVTLASTVSGIPGGLFAPSLAVGAGVGSTIGLILGSNAGLAAILGMTGYFAGVVQSPMTAFIIIFEMTADASNLPALMVAAMLGYGTSRLISPQPLYHGLARFWIADALTKQRAQERAAEAAKGRPAA